jgi:toxin ParE1/3/4
MKNVRFRPKTWEDVEESAFYLAEEASQATAERFLDAIVMTTGALARLPRMGAPCHFHNPRLRGIRRHPVTGFENWLVFYHAAATGVEVVRVLHGARDIATVLREENCGL